MIDTNNTIELAMKGGLREESARALISLYEAGHSAVPRWKSELFATCEPVIARIIETEYDAKTPGIRGIGRMETTIPRLAGEFPGVAHPSLEPIAKNASLDAAQGALFSLAGALSPQAVPASGRAPSEHALWEESVVTLFNGFVGVNEDVGNQQDLAQFIYRLGIGASNIIQQTAASRKVALSGDWFRTNPRKLFVTILFFHATIGWTVGACAASLVRRSIKS